MEQQPYLSLFDAEEKSVKLDESEKFATKNSNIKPDFATRSHKSGNDTSFYKW